jgi:hypothetical protein
LGPDGPTIELVADLIGGWPVKLFANVAHVGSAIARSTDEPAKRMKHTATAIATWRREVGLVVSIFLFLPDSPHVEHRIQRNSIQRLIAGNGLNETGIHRSFGIFTKREEKLSTQVNTL